MLRLWRVESISCVQHKTSPCCATCPGQEDPKSMVDVQRRSRCKRTISSATPWMPAPRGAQPAARLLAQPKQFITRCAHHVKAGIADAVMGLITNYVTITMTRPARAPPKEASQHPVRSPGRVITRHASQCRGAGPSSC